MKESINLRWLKNMAFEADVDGFKIKVDAKSEVGGSNLGPRPKPLLLVSLAGCTAMDVASLMKKMRVEVEDINIIVEGDLTEEHPKQFTKLHVIYEFKGENLPMDKLEKAVSLSQEKYCGVSATLKKALELTYEIKIV
ncbi:MAG: OsmC family protein [Bacteroidales bacterium]|nr:OsmC family protein [Bacteroidales bacterium]